MAPNNNFGIINISYTKIEVKPNELNNKQKLGYIRSRINILP